jgi:hypothetical protein
VVSGPITVEPGERSDTPCACCGDHSHTVWGELLGGDGATLAVYYAGWIENPADHPELWLTLSLGPWGGGASGGDRATVPIVAFRDGDAWSFGAHDHGRLPDDETLLGRRLTREEVLAHPRIGEIWALADALWLGDPRIAEAAAGR